MAKFMTSYEYTQAHGRYCPECGSKNIEGLDLDIDCCEVTQLVICNACGTTWKDLYTLQGYIDLELGSDTEGNNDQDTAG